MVLSLAISIALFLFFLLNFYFRELLIPSEEADPVSASVLVLIVLLGWGTIFVLLFLLFLLNFRILRGGLPERKKLWAVILCSILFTVVYSIAVSGAISTVVHNMELVPPRPDPDHAPPPAHWVGVIRDLFLTLIVVFISQILYLNQKRLQVELRNEALEAENMRTRYEALKNQVNPHFLFNTLSTLDAMVGTEPARAREYIQKMSSVFRYTLKNKDVVTLGEEMEFVRDYSDLMQIRHGDNLKIVFDTAERYNGYLMVPMAVQGLVENAIKHNAFSDSSPLTVTIKTDGDGMLTVANRYQPREYPEPGEGVGLANLAERYRLKWHREISIGNADGAFVVSLPLIPPEQ